MIDVLEKELAVHQIRLINRNVYECGGEEMSIRSGVKRFKASAQENKKLIMRLWNELCSLIDEESKGDTCEDLSNLFIPAIKGLYHLSSRFKNLRETGVVSCLKRAIDRDIKDFSGLTMGKVIDFKLSIDWVNHLINRDMYICALFKKFREVSRHKNVVIARGIMGPWSNLDLPMRERWFEWDDVEEETAGREQDKRNQRRYIMGLENYGEGDSTPNEGWYFREIRNEPYDFDDEDGNPYPHRNLLWQ